MDAPRAEVMQPFVLPVQPALPAEPSRKPAARPKAWTRTRREAQGKARRAARRAGSTLTFLTACAEGLTVLPVVLDEGKLG